MARKNASRGTARRSTRTRTRSRKSHSFLGRSLYHRQLRLEQLEDRRLLAVVTVTTLADTVDLNDGVTSLREAIVAPPVVVGQSNTVTFAPALTASGPATILLTHGELVPLSGIAINGPGSGVLTIDASGNDPTPLLDNGDGSRVFNLQSNLTITGLGLTGGDVTGEGGAIRTQGVLTLDGVIVRNNHATKAGGGIFSQSAGLVIRNSIVSGNSTSSDNSVGGGLAIDGGNSVNARLTVDRSRITENSATGSGAAGGGVYGHVSNVAISGSSIAGNVASGSGGGIAQIGKSLSIESSLIYGNRTFGSGGGVFGNVDTITISDSTLSTNVAGSSGGGAYIGSTSPTGSGATIAYSTVYANSAGSLGAGAGGGIFLARGPLHLNDTIVAGNTASFGRDLTGLLGQSIIPQYSLVGSSADSGLVPIKSGKPDANGNLVGGASTGFIDPLLGGLADNGGPTQSHAPLPDSPALDAGDPVAVAGAAGVPQYDQRGASFTRVFGGRIDIGAVERQNVGGPLDIVVDTLVDESDGSLSPGDVSLREAIGLANGNAGVADTIRFDPSLAGGTIVLTQGELQINDAVTIVGIGATQLTIDASGNDPTPSENSGEGSRIFNVDDGKKDITAAVQISGLALTGGDSQYGGAVFNYESLTLSQCTISGNVGTQLGGGIASFAGSLTVNNCAISNNFSTGDGGGIRSLDTIVTLADSSVTGNTGLNGGGIYSYHGELNVSGSRIMGNVATGNVSTGGGIHSEQQTLLVTNSTISGNSADLGGGIYANSGIYSTQNVHVIESTIANNSATLNGGGIDSHGGIDVTSSMISDNSSGSDGGGIWAANRLTLDSSTVARNSAGGDGGGIYLRSELFDDPSTLTNATISGNKSVGDGAGVWISSASAPVDVTFSTFALNSTSAARGGGIFIDHGNVELGNSIVATNTAPIGPDITGLFGGSVMPHFSLIGNNADSGILASAIPDPSGNLVGESATPINPRLGPLVDNGGPTPTHAPQSNSPATNRGDPTAIGGANGVPTNDQRGAPFTRVYSVRVDMGAYERQTLPTLNLVVDTLSDEQNFNYGAGDLSLREALALTNGSANSMDTIGFSPSLFTTGPATIMLLHGELPIRDSVQIVGPGATLLTIDGSGDDPTPQQKIGDGIRLFNIDTANGGTPIVALSGVSLAGGDVADVGGGIRNLGNLTISDCVIRDNSSGRDGGGIYSGNGSLSVTHSTIAQNQARAGNGGGIFSSTAANGVLVDGTAITGNLASGDGGGLRIGSSLRASITRSTIAGNSADGDGGGLWISTFAFLMYGDSSDVRDSTISGNAASRSGGGIYNDFWDLSVVNSTISSNTADMTGGGFYNNGGNISVAFSTITGNSAPLGGGMVSSSDDATRVKSTIVAGNENGDVDYLYFRDNSYQSDGYNLVGTGNALSAFVRFGDRTNILDPKLKPLAENGGPTLTHVPMPDSPAVDAGSQIAMAGVGGVPVNDQRGASFMRVFGGRIDIGAIESQPNPLPGDYNFNGVVDAADYTVWRDTLGSTTDLRANGDNTGASAGKIDQADYALWMAHFGQTLSGSGAGAEVGNGESGVASEVGARSEERGASVELVQTPFVAIDPGVGGSRALDPPYESTPRPSLGALSVPPHLAVAARPGDALLAWLASQSGGRPRHDDAMRDAIPTDRATDRSVDSLSAVDDVFAALTVVM